MIVVADSVALVYESKNSYSVVVEASDGHGGTDTALVTGTGGGGSDGAETGRRARMATEAGQAVPRELFQRPAPALGLPEVKELDLEPSHVERLLAHDDVDFVHARNVTGGCFAFAATRA